MITHAAWAWKGRDRARSGMNPGSPPITVYVVKDGEPAAALGGCSSDAGATYRPMIRSERIRTGLLTLLLGFQGLGVVVPLADAQLDAPGAVEHVEEPGADDSRRAHVHGDCALCQHLANRQAAVVGAPVLVLAAPIFQARSPEAEIAVDGRAAPSQRGRSPPFV